MTFTAKDLPAPLEGAEPNPLAVAPAPSGAALSDTRSYRPPVRANRKQANPYLDDNPYRAQGPGSPGPTDDQAPHDYRDGPEEASPATGAPPEVTDNRLPHPQDETPKQKAASRQPAREFTGHTPDVVDRLAARVLAANPDCEPADARRVALATLNRFPAVGRVQR